MSTFSVTVQTAAGLPLKGAAVRLLAPDGTDITASRFGASPVYTDATGVFSRPYAGSAIQLSLGGLPLGNYQIVASLPGYAPGNTNTGGLFQGYGTFQISLNAAASSAGSVPGDSTPGTSSTTTSGLASIYVSPMVPCEFTAQGVAPTAPWELIEATITDATGHASVMEVDVVAGQALVNIQARLDLAPLPHLVSDGDLVIVDDDFSKTFSITLASLTPSGRQALSNMLNVVAANAFPLHSDDSLIGFTNDSDATGEWLTPWADSELPKFSGHYADCMIWLPLNGDTYQLQVDFQNVNKAALSTQKLTLPTLLTAQKRVMRVRIPEPIVGAVYAVLTVYLGTIIQSKPLIIHYLNG